MTNEHDDKLQTPTEPERAVPARGFTAAFSSQKVIAAVLNAAFDPCTCQSCETLRDIGREIAGALNAGPPAEVPT